MCVVLGTLESFQVNNMSFRANYVPFREWQLKLCPKSDMLLSIKIWDRKYGTSASKRVVHLVPRVNSEQKVRQRDETIVKNIVHGLYEQYDRGGTLGNRRQLIQRYYL